MNSHLSSDLDERWLFVFYSPARRSGSCSFCDLRSVGSFIGQVRPMNGLHLTTASGSMTRRSVTSTTHPKRPLICQR